MKRIEQRSKKRIKRRNKVWTSMNHMFEPFQICSNHVKTIAYSCKRVAKACPLVGPSLNDEIDDASKFSAPNVHIPGNKTGTRREHAKLDMPWLPWGIFADVWYFWSKFEAICSQFLPSSIPTIVPKMAEDVKPSNFEGWKLKLKPKNCTWKNP